MKIAIDARMIKPSNMHGIARYVYNLIDQLSQRHSPFQFVVFTSKNSPLLKRQWPEHIQMVRCHANWISFREHLELPYLLRKFAIDLFHAPSYVAPLNIPCQMIMTIHDLNHLVLPQFYTPFHQIYYQIIVRNCIRRSRYILTVSRFSKAEIVRTLGLDEQKVFVTYNGVSSRYQPIDNPKMCEYVRSIYQLPEEFIFCLSNNKPHKNVAQLVRAYCYSQVELPLVLACPFDRQLITIAEKFGKKHRIFFSSFINEEHLPVIYSMTRLFVYPSTYEGFGLPPLEALACGSPVLISRSSSLPEVVGSHGIFVNPHDYVDIARGLEQGIQDKELKKKMRQWGPLHAQQFSWSEMTEKTLEVYSRCLKECVPIQARTPEAMTINHS